MSIFATVAIVCTMSACNDYVIDHEQSAWAATIDTTAHIQVFNKVWEDEKGLTNWLNKFEIHESIFEIVSIDIETQEIKQDEIP